MFALRMQGECLTVAYGSQCGVGPRVPGAQAHHVPSCAQRRARRKARGAARHAAVSRPGGAQSLKPEDGLDMFVGTRLASV